MKATFNVVIYDTTNHQDDGFIIETFSTIEAAEKFAREENLKNYLSNSCEIAVVE